MLRGRQIKELLPSDFMAERCLLPLELFKTGISQRVLENFRLYSNLNGGKLNVKRLGLKGRKHSKQWGALENDDYVFISRLVFCLNGGCPSSF